jgi:hypothetical protein
MLDLDRNTVDMIVTCQALDDMARAMAGLPVTPSLLVVDDVVDLTGEVGILSTAMDEESRNVTYHLVQAKGGPVRLTYTEDDGSVYEVGQVPTSPPPSLSSADPATL